MDVMQWLGALIILAAALFGFFRWENHGIRLTMLQYKSEKLPRSCQGKRIVQISDLHDGCFGKNNEKLLEMIRRARPDWIGVTGDVFDRRRPHLERSADFLRRAAQIAPLYYVTGNHENWSPLFPAFREMIRGNGAVLLEDRGLLLDEDEEGRRLILYGLMDHSINRQRASGGVMSREEGREKNAGKMEVLLREMKEKQERLSPEGPAPLRVLLSHRPEQLAVYAKEGFDLVFCGHAHGGQIRLPFVGGLYAPSQGWLPAYTSGIHTMGGTSMAVSRGLGNSQMPLRIFNRPEILVLTLQNPSFP